MKYVMVLLAGIVLSGSGVLAAAADASADNEKAVETVRKLEEKWAAAAPKKDTAPLEEMLADDYTLTSPDGHIVDKSTFIERIKDGTLVIDSLEYSDLKIRVWGKTAVVTGRLTLKAKWSDNDIGGNYAFTDTFVRQSKKWHEVAGQVTKIEE